MTCKKCEQVSVGKICRVQIGRFPQIMELRMEFGSQELQNAVGWKDLRIPRYLDWSGIRYKFIGVILRDEKAEHFSTYVEIHNNLYAYQDDLERLREGLLRLSNTSLNPDEALSLSAAMLEGSRTVPSRFYYLKDDERDSTDEWTEVRVEHRPGRTELRPPPIELDKEPNTPKASEKMDIDDIRTG